MINKTNSKTEKLETPLHNQITQENFANLYTTSEYDEQKERRKQKRLDKKMEVAQSSDGVDPLYNSEELPEDIVKKIKNQDKHFKKEQRTKALNIINEEEHSLNR